MLRWCVVVSGIKKGGKIPSLLNRYGFVDDPVGSLFQAPVPSLGGGS